MEELSPKVNVLDNQVDALKEQVKTLEFNLSGEDDEEDHHDDNGGHDVSDHAAGGAFKSSHPPPPPVAPLAEHRADHALNGDPPRGGDAPAAFASDADARLDAARCAQAAEVRHHASHDQDCVSLHNKDIRHGRGSRDD